MLEFSAEPQLQKLSPGEFRAYNRMADHMEYFVSESHQFVACSG